MPKMMSPSTHPMITRSKKRKYQNLQHSTIEKSNGQSKKKKKKKNEPNQTKITEYEIIFIKMRDCMKTLSKIIKSFYSKSIIKRRLDVAQTFSYISKTFQIEFNIVETGETHVDLKLAGVKPAGKCCIIGKKKPTSIWKNTDHIKCDFMRFREFVKQLKTLTEGHSLSDIEFPTSFENLKIIKNSTLSTLQFSSKEYCESEKVWWNVDLESFVIRAFMQYKKREEREGKLEMKHVNEIEFKKIISAMIDNFEKEGTLGMIDWSKYPIPPLQCSTSNNSKETPCEENQNCEKVAFEEGCNSDEEILDLNAGI